MWNSDCGSVGRVTPVRAAVHSQSIGGQRTARPTLVRMDYVRRSDRVSGLSRKKNAASVASKYKTFDDRHPPGQDIVPAVFLLHAFASNCRRT